MKCLLPDGALWGRDREEARDRLAWAVIVMRRVENGSQKSRVGVEVFFLVSFSYTLSASYLRFPYSAQSERGVLVCFYFWLPFCPVFAFRDIS